MESHSGAESPGSLLRLNNSDVSESTMIRSCILRKTAIPEQSEPTFSQLLFG